MAMKFMLLAFAFMLIATSNVSSMAKAQIHNDQTEAPIYLLDSPMMAPVYNSDVSPTLAPIYEKERPDHPCDDSPIEAPVYFSETPEGPSESPIYFSDYPVMAPVSEISEVPSESPMYISDYPVMAPVSEISEVPSESPMYISDYPVMAPVYEFPSESPIYFSDYPVMAPIYHSDPPMVIQPVTPPPHIPKHCAVGCVEYCRSKPINISKRSCQRICSVCCQKCECIPQSDKHMSCGSWDKIMYHGVQVKCP